MAGYLQEQGVSRQGSDPDNCFSLTRILVDKDLVRLHLFICFKLVFFFFLLLPFSHVFSDSQPPTQQSTGTARDDFVIS